MKPSAGEEIPLDVRVFKNTRTEGKMKLERGGLESSSAGTGLEGPRQQRLSSWKMQRTTVDGKTSVLEDLGLRD